MLLSFIINLQPRRSRRHLLHGDHVFGCRKHLLAWLTSARPQGTSVLPPKPYGQRTFNADPLPTTIDRSSTRTRPTQTKNLFTVAQSPFR